MKARNSHDSLNRFQALSIWSGSPHSRAGPHLETWLLKFRLLKIPSFVVEFEKNM